MKYRAYAVFLAGAVVSLAAGWLAFPKLLYERSAAPVQFSHRVHTETVGSACEDCHAISAGGRFGGIPTLETCAACHSAPVTDKPEEKRMIEQFIEPNREIPWPVYARQPDNVSFSHAVHAKLAKLACEECHGDHGKTESLRPYERNRITGYSRDIWGPSISRIASEPGKRMGMKMADCEGCHREQNVETSCLACHK